MSEMWEDLQPLIGALVHFPDPALMNSDTLLLEPLSQSISQFGVEFGTTSPSGEVIGSLQAVPAAPTLWLAALGLLALVAGRGRRRSLLSKA